VLRLIFTHCKCLLLVLISLSLSLSLSTSLFGLSLLLSLKLLSFLPSLSPPLLYFTFSLPNYLHLCCFSFFFSIQHSSCPAEDSATTPRSTTTEKTRSWSGPTPSSATGLTLEAWSFPGLCAVTSPFKTGLSISSTNR
jgi:hypothetical protein